MSIRPSPSDLLSNNDFSAEATTAPDHHKKEEEEEVEINVNEVDNDPATPPAYLPEVERISNVLVFDGCIDSTTALLRKTSLVGWYQLVFQGQGSNKRLKATILLNELSSYLKTGVGH